MNQTHHHILIVDDEKFLCLSLARLLKKNGYDSAIAETGEAAIRLIQANPALFSLAMIDLNMPGMGGEETAKRLREMVPNLKIAIITGHSNNFALDGSNTTPPQLNFGDAFLFKPFEHGAVMETVKRLIEKT